MSTQQKWLAAIAAAVVAFFAVWGINVTYDPDPTTPPDTIVEPPDTTFQLTADPLPGRIALSWSDPPDQTAVVWVVWSATGEENSGQRLATLGPNGTSTVDTIIDPGETRFYRVILVDDTDDLFFFSDWVEATALEDDESPEVDSLSIVLSADTVLVGDSVRACLFGWTQGDEPELVPLVGESWDWEPEDPGVQLSLASGNGHCQWFRGVSSATASGVIDLRRLAIAP